MRDDSVDQLRRSLRRFMELANLTVAGWTREAGLSEGTLRNFLAGKSATLTHASLAALARASRQPVSALIGEAPLVGLFVEPIAVVHEVDVSPGTNTLLMKMANSIDAYLPLNIYLPPDLRFPGAERFGAVIRDDSASHLYSRGSIVICVDFVDVDVDRRPATGDHVLVTERFRPTHEVELEAGLDEKCLVTIREVDVNKETGETWLTLPASYENLPRGVHPMVSLTGEIMRFEGERGFHHLTAGVDTTIEGLIVASYSLKATISHNNTTQD